MKKLLQISLLLLLSQSLFAQLDRSKKPDPAPAPTIEIGTYESFTLKNGLRVFVVTNSKLPRVLFSLEIDIDPIYEGSKAGYTSIAGDLIGRGTKTYTKAELDAMIDFMGARLTTSSQGISASCLSKHAERTFQLFADVLINPSFPEAEFSKIKEQLKSGIKSGEDDPSTIAANVANAVTYGKLHPYGEVATKESVDAVSLEDCIKYYNTFFKPGASYLVIVGDITLKKAKKLVTKYLDKWPAGEIPTFQYETPANPAQSYVAFVNRDASVQSIIQVMNLVDLKPGSPDVVKMAVTNEILGGGSDGRLYLNLREDKGYTYGAYSSYGTDELIAMTSCEVSVRNAVTDSALVEILYEMGRMGKELVSEEDLQSTKNYLTGSFGRSLESPSTIARFARNIEKYKLPKDYYQNYLVNLNAVTAEDVREMGAKYFSPERSTILVVGKYSDVAPSLKKFGKMRYFDVYGDPTEEPSIALPEGVTAEMVIENYINAIGGKENLAAIMDVTIEQKIEVQGSVLLLNQVYKAPNKSKQSMSMQGMELFSSTYDGKRVKAVQQGMPVPVEGNELLDYDLESRFVPELFYQELGLQLLLKGAKVMDKSKVYEVEVVKPSGSRSSYYFDMETGLKIAKTEIVPGPQGDLVQKTDYQNYAEYNGILFPEVIIVPLGPQRLESKLVKIEFNTGVKDSLFKIE